jgi:hypothetical protein
LYLNKFTGGFFFFGRSKLYSWTYCQQTESRDIEILEISMLRTIFELVPCRKVYFFKTVEDGLDLLSGASLWQKRIQPL